jgi:TatA/E family protein of Tat protein translocase
MLAGPDVLVILLIALFLFGPKKLPEIGQAIGKAMREFRKASEEMRGSFEEEIQEVENTKGHSASMNVASVLPEKPSEPMALPERTEEMSLPKTEIISETRLPLEGTPIPASPKEHDMA